jgi:2'-5' RNA ligase
MDTTSLIIIPGYNYNEYLLVLKPHEDLCNKISQVKKDFYEKYKTPVSFGNSHLTLANFIQFDMREEKLVNRLNTIAMNYPPFKIELRDFGSLPTHTIFINIESKQQVQNLVKELRPAQQLMTLNKETKPHFITDPNFTVARKLLPWQFEKSWADYSHRHFSGGFIADGMLLLKRKLTSVSEGNHSAGKYQVVRRFEFMNLPVATRQGELFM